MNMTNEETYLRSKMGNSNPFLVPDGYFEHLADSVMHRLPEETKKPALVVRLRPWLYAAACACLVVGGTVLYMQRDTISVAQQHIAAKQTSTQPDEPTIDEAADYAMLDNHDIYACLMSE